MTLDVFETVIVKINLLERKVRTKVIRELEVKRRYRVYREQYKPNQEIIELVTKYQDVVFSRLQLKRRKNQILSYMSFS